jgi:hypothetical protein
MWLAPTVFSDPIQFVWMVNQMVSQRGVVIFWPA